MKVDLTDFVHHILILVGNKAEAPVPVGLLIEHEHGVLDLKQEHWFVDLEGEPGRMESLTEPGNGVRGGLSHQGLGGGEGR